MLKKDFKPQLIKFKKFAFEQALKNYTEKIKVENKIETFFLSKLNTTDAPDLDADIFNQALTILQNDSTNVMQLDAQKFAELKRINLNELKQLCQEYAKVKKYHQPNENDFSVFTQNEKENENLKIYSDFITAYYNLVNLLPNSSFNRYEFYNSFSNWIEWNHASHTVEPSEKFIKICSKE
jgi:hypothetical protein